MNGPTLLQRAFRRRADRKRWGMLLLAVAGFAVLWPALGWVELGNAARADAEAGGVDYSLAVEEPRVCAAAAAYTLSTGDHWDQRAAIANAALNRFATLGHVPDCGTVVAKILADGLDRYRWQASLDAADAVMARSYDLPNACAPADAVLPSVDSARAPCVIGDLAFVETAR